MKTTKYHGMKKFAAYVTAGALSMVALTNAATAAKKQPFTGIVNLNTATEAQLMQLPGIGKAKAQAIITQRSTAPFREPSDLKKVKGVSENLFAKLRDHVTVSGSASAGGVHVQASPGAAGNAGK